MAFEIGLYHFGEITPDPATGKTQTAQERLNAFIEQATLADEVGLDYFGVGEHHRSDFAVSAPAVVLGAISQRTKNIKLGPAVTVLSSDDPVRVFQQYATLDLLSNGRAEIMAGRGSYTESFPLFGFDLNDYNDLYAEKIDLLLKIRDEHPLTWQGRMRPSLQDADIAPRPLQEKLPIWIAVGGNAASAVRAGILGVPMALAILTGSVEQFRPLVDLYYEAGGRAGHKREDLTISINSPGFIAPTADEAIEISYPYYAAGMLENFHQRGQGFRMPRRSYEAQMHPLAASLIGGPNEVIESILAHHEVMGHSREVVQLGFGNVPQKDALKAIEILGTEVAPVVRKEIAKRESVAVS
jgi:probable LLM family oxidoreductase